MGYIQRLTPEKLAVFEGEGFDDCVYWWFCKTGWGLVAWWQAGYGVWFVRNSERNHAVPIPAPESVSRAELRGVLHAMRSRRAGDRMVTVLDPEYVFKGITEWSAKLERHGWRSRGKEIVHRDLWQDIWELRQAAGSHVVVLWTPSQLTVKR